MTRDEKEAFYAQYWGQTLTVYTGFGFADKDLIVINRYSIDVIESIELKSLADISDEDAEHYYDLVGLQSEIGDYIDKFNQEATDYLRSKSYALPFRQYSVEDLVKEGVIKLI